MASAIRSVVSKKKKRFTEDGYNLDLTYITPRLIAMGFPSSGIEGMYRNPLSEVQRFFKSRHPEHYMVINLCAEKAYNLEGLFFKVAGFGFYDHNPCPFDLMYEYCKCLDEWFAEHPKNVAGIHCKAGKGRTGLMIAVYLVHCGMYSEAQAALKKFDDERTHNGKGVTIPSQMRYVHYYHQAKNRGLLTDGEKIMTPVYQITHVRLVTVPAFEHGGGTSAYFQIKYMWMEKNPESGVYQSKEKLIYDYRMKEKHIKKVTADSEYVDIDCSSHNLLVKGDCKIIFFDHDQFAQDTKMFHAWFNTAFIENNFLSFKKPVIDKACKDTKCKYFNNDFAVEIFMHAVGTDIEFPHDVDS